jgi:NhaP-type Na+/H+ or K+/H+ antiporter
MWAQVGQLGASLLLQVAASRAAFLLVMIPLANTWRSNRIGWRQGAFIWWAGLMRGAISIALTFHHFYDTASHGSSG